MAKRRVLYIDDDESSRCLVEEVLTEEGYDVVTEVDVTGGYQAARTSRFDLLLLDLDLGGDESGRTVLDLLFSRAEWIPPTVLVTGHGDAALKDMFPRALPLRVRKPLDLDELVTIVARVTGTRMP